MSRISSNQSGFSAIEGLLIVIIVLLIGFIGYYVHHTQQQTDAINNAAAKVALSSPAKGSVKKANTSTTTVTPQATTKYLTIKEWGVRLPYTGTDTYSYRMSSSGTETTIISSQLAATVPGCDTFGAGQITRFLSSDAIYDGGPTAAADAAQNPSLYGHVGNYYYRFVHDQGACADTVNDTTFADQNTANSAVGALVPKIQAAN